MLSLKYSPHLRTTLSLALQHFVYLKVASSRKDIDAYTKFVSRYGARGLAYIKVNALADGVAGLKSPILKFLPDEVAMSIMERVGAEDGDLVFFGADKEKIVNDALGALREELAKDRGLLVGDWAALWIVDFPMFEWDDEKRALASLASSVYCTNL